MSDRNYYVPVANVLQPDYVYPAQVRSTSPASYVSPNGVVVEPFEVSGPGSENHVKLHSATPFDRIDEAAKVESLIIRDKLTFDAQRDGQAFVHYESKAVAVASNDSINTSETYRAKITSHKERYFDDSQIVGSTVERGVDANDIALGYSSTPNVAPSAPVDTSVSNKANQGYEINEYKSMYHTDYQVKEYKSMYD